MATPAKPRVSAIPGPGRSSGLPTPRSRSSSSADVHPPNQDVEYMSRAFADAIKANDPARHRSARPSDTSSSTVSLSPSSTAVSHSVSGRFSATGRPSSSASNVSASAVARPKTPSTVRPPSRVSDVFGRSVSRAERTYDVGDNVRIESLGYEGTLRFMGEIDGKAGLWAGVELSGGFAGKGKNDGSVAGKHYFTCPPKCGVFVASTKLSAPTVGPGAQYRPSSVASSRSGRITPSASSSVGGRITPSMSTGRRTPSISSGRVTPGTTPAARFRIPSKTPQRTPAKPAPPTTQITPGSRASKYAQMTAKQLSTGKPKAELPRAIGSASPTRSISNSSSTGLSGITSPFQTPKPKLGGLTATTSAKLSGIGLGFGSPSAASKGTRPSLGGTPRARLPSAIAMPPPASPQLSPSRSASRSEKYSLSSQDVLQNGRALSDRIAELTTGGRITPSSADGSITAASPRPESVASLRMEHRNQIERMQARLDALEYDNERLRADRASTPAQDPSVLENAQKARKAEELQSELTNASKKLADLEKELETVRKSASDAGFKSETQEEKHREELASLQARYDEQSTRMTEIEDNLEEAMQELRRTVTVVEDKAKEEIERLEQLEAKTIELEASKTEIHRVKTAFEEERADLSSQVDELRQAGQETIALYEEKLNVTESQRYELESKIAALEVKLRRQPQPSDEPASDLPLTSSAAQIDNESLREHITHLQKRVTSLEDALEDARALAEREETAMRERLQRMRDKEDASKKELIEVKREMDKMTKSEARANDRILEIEEALRESSVALENAQAEVETMRTEIADLDSLLGNGSEGDLHSRVGEVLQKSASEKTRYTAEISRLKTALEESEKNGSAALSSDDAEHLEVLQSKNIELVEQVAEQQALLAEEQRASAELHNLLDEKVAELENLKKKANREHTVNGTTVQTAPVTPTKELAVAREEIKGLKHIVQELQMESSASQQRHEVLQSENNLLTTEIKQLREEVAILEENLDKSISQEEGGVEPSALTSVKNDAELGQLRKKLSESEQKVARVTHDLNKEITELESLVESKIYREDELEQEIERLKEKLARREKKSSKSSVETSSIRSRVSSNASSDDAPPTDVCEICEQPGHDIFSCNLLKDDSPGGGSKPPTSTMSLPDADLYCEDCDGHGHLAADCPHSLEVF